MLSERAPLAGGILKFAGLCSVEVFIEGDWKLVGMKLSKFSCEGLCYGKKFSANFVDIMYFYLSYESVLIFLFIPPVCT